MKVKIKRTTVRTEDNRKIYFASRYEGKKLGAFSLMTTYKGK